MGKWSILYFGFTHCPDICPDELIKLAAAIDKISELPTFLSFSFLWFHIWIYCVSKVLIHIFTEEKSGVDVVPVFISVDPERDTVQQVHEYVKGRYS